MIVKPGASGTPTDTLPPVSDMPIAKQEYLESYALTYNATDLNFIRSQEPKSPEEIYQRLRYFPNQVLLETSSFCQLQCVMCARQFNPRKWGKMDDALAKRIIDEVMEKAPWVRMWFCYFGEPLVSRKLGLYERIRYAKAKGLKRAAINTNGNLLDDETLDRLMEAGLDEIYIGIDATTKETYEQKVRIGGNFDVLMRNIHRAIERSQGRLQISVQFAVLDVNQHEVEDFKAYWSNYPVQIYVRPKMTWINYLSDEIHADMTKRHACAWIFDSINVNEDGRVPYCINDWEGKHVHGDLNNESIFDVWQNKVYPFLVAHATKQWDKLPGFCQTCPDWQSKRPHNLDAIALFAANAEADLMT
ncbi:putative Radical SAM domain protein [Magnetospirillum sp. LM-5]|uniref:radical SAM/SPASM domain-containing protein n=1 Tax=Magnetospirillum sp. LM-5 TaxID=2681466 RepID=UPI00138494DE|nr:radical SAM/SPASM domain-containing protein [Magnetospirillum sp. LM-5]CAA7618731.1 putative Radical SAM domain protein [Magnetospirillum sp. LM-5]